MMLDLGADIYLDYSSAQFDKQLAIYDCIFVAIDALDFETSMRHLKEGGAFIHIVRPFKSREMRRAGRSGKAHILVGDNVKPSSENLEYLARLVDEGKLEVYMDKVYPISEIVEAHRYVDTGRKRGNVIIRVADNF
jgi:NADPH:quinone reductase-like Zn-dependent oxidoreductase